MMNLTNLNLDISDNGLGVQGAANLAECVSKLLNLTNMNLDISHNTIGKEGAEKLFEGF